MTAKKLWMNGFTCLGCGKGFYDGYDASKRLTRPCGKCGHQAPDRMLPIEFKRAHQARDQRLYGKEPKCPTSSETSSSNWSPA